jgi:hypothetical protein
MKHALKTGLLAGQTQCKDCCNVLAKHTRYVEQHVEKFNLTLQSVLWLLGGVGVDILITREPVTVLQLCMQFTPYTVSQRVTVAVYKAHYFSHATTTCCVHYHSCGLAVYVVSCLGRFVLLMCALFLSGVEWRYHCCWYCYCSTCSRD